MLGEVKTEYIICPECKGSGQTEKRKNLYESETCPCPTCAGCRILYKKTEVTYHKVNQVV